MARGPEAIGRRAVARAVDRREAGRATGHAVASKPTRCDAGGSGEDDARRMPARAHGAPGGLRLPRRASRATEARPRRQAFRSTPPRSPVSAASRPPCVGPLPDALLPCPCRAARCPSTRRARPGSAKELEFAVLHRGGAEGGDATARAERAALPGHGDSAARPGPGAATPRRHLRTASRPGAWPSPLGRFLLPTEDEAPRARASEAEDVAPVRVDTASEEAARSPSRPDAVLPETSPARPLSFCRAQGQIAPRCAALLLPRSRSSCSRAAPRRRLRPRRRRTRRR